MAMAVASKLALYPFVFFTINAQKMTSTGITATSADREILLNGSMTCFQCIREINFQGASSNQRTKIQDRMVQTSNRYDLNFYKLNIYILEFHWNLELSTLILF